MDRARKLKSVIEDMSPEALSKAPTNGITISVNPPDGSSPVISADPSMRPEVTSAVAAKAARMMSMSCTPELGSTVVVVAGATVVVATPRFVLCGGLGVAFPVPESSS